MRILIINPPRYDNSSVTREQRCELIMNYRVDTPATLLIIASLLREKNYQIKFIDANGINWYLERNGSQVDSGSGNLQELIILGFGVYNYTGYWDGNENYTSCYEQSYLTVNQNQTNPLDLIDLDLDIVGIPTPVWHWVGKNGERPIYFNAYKKVVGGYTEWPDKNGLQEVDAIGSGCMLISRRVFEDPEMRKKPFLRVWNDDGTVERGCDIAFCERAKKRGFKVWAHYNYMADHIVKVSLIEVLKAFSGLGVK